MHHTPCTRYLSHTSPVRAPSGKRSIWNEKGGKKGWIREKNVISNFFSSYPCVNCVCVFVYCVHMTGDLIELN